MCILIIELIWVEKYGKIGEKPPFLGNFEGWYRYHKCSVNRYRYRYPMLYFDQCLYFGHNLVISYPILVIQVAGKNRLQGEQISQK